MKPRVLIADADELLLAAYSVFLVAEGFEVIAVSSGVACIEALRRQPVSLLVLTSDLPWGSGLGVLDLMRQEGLAMPPVLLLTDNPAQIPHRVVPVHDYALMIKPVPPTTVAHVARTLVASSWGKRAVGVALKS